MKRPWLMLRLLIVFACALFALAGCSGFEGETILTWNDNDTATQVEVRSQIYGGKNRVHMQVTRGGKTDRLVLADRVELKHASLVRFNDWLLVLGGPYVLGGYDLQNAKIVPVNSDALPFTVRGISGYVVDEKQIGEGEDVPPFNFRERGDPRQ